VCQRGEPIGDTEKILQESGKAGIHILRSESQERSPHPNTGSSTKIGKKRRMCCQSGVKKSVNRREKALLEEGGPSTIGKRGGERPIQRDYHANDENDKKGPSFILPKGGRTVVGEGKRGPRTRCFLSLPTLRREKKRLDQIKQSGDSRSKGREPLSGEKLAISGRESKSERQRGQITLTSRRFLSRVRRDLGAGEKGEKHLKNGNQREDLDLSEPEEERRREKGEAAVVGGKPDRSEVVECRKKTKGNIKPPRFYLRCTNSKGNGALE